MATSDSKKLASILKTAGIKNSKTGKAITTSDIKKALKSTSSSSSSSQTSTTTPTKTLTYAPGSVETMTASQAAAAGKTSEYNAVVGGFNTTSTPNQTPTATSNKPLSQMTVAEAAAAGKTTEYNALVSGAVTPAATVSPVGKTVTGSYNGTTFYSDGTTSNDTANKTTTSGALPGIENMSQEDFVKKLTEMGIVSSVPVREEIPEETLPKPLTAQTYDEFKSEISNYSPKAPEAPQVADIYTEQRQKLGISALEDEINGYDAQKAELLAEMDNFKRQENVGQSASFAAGRVSAGAQNVQDKIDALERSQSIAINKLNTKNTFLENLIKFTKDDYATANSNYQFEFNKNLQLQQMFSSKQDKVADDARATLNTFNNIIANSGMTYDDMSASMKAQINVQEMQAGMPIGTMELYARSKPKSNAMGSDKGVDADGNEFTTFFSKNEDGTISQEKIYTGGVSKTGSSEKTKTEQANDIAEAILRFKDTMDAKGWMGANPEEYRYYRDYIQTTYGSAAVLLLNKAMEDAGISVDNENK
jgi:hypothetical protein